MLKSGNLENGLRWPLTITFTVLPSGSIKYVPSGSAVRVAPKTLPLSGAEFGALTGKLPPLAPVVLGLVISVGSCALPPFSTVPETEALFVIESGADALTLTVTVMSGKLSPAFKTSLRVQEAEGTSHVQPVPLISVIVKSAGANSCTVITSPAVGNESVLVTCKV